MTANSAYLQCTDWDALSTAEQVDILKRPLESEDQQLAQAVAEILQAVRNQGDAALRDYAARFDSCQLDQLEVSNECFAQLDTSAYEQVLRAMDQAAANIAEFHRAGKPQAYSVETSPGVTCRAEYRPLSRVGLYIPAGTAPLISTLMMLAIPAKLAGCREIILCSPPQADGECAPIIMAAAQRLGVSRLFRCGGAQAVAAMAYGTASIPRCDKIFGPGNRWVTEAKRQVAASSQGTAIDMPAGPSEVMVIADDKADPHKVALDLLSQAEHGPDSQVFLISDSAELINNTEHALQQWLQQLPRAETAQQALSNSHALLVNKLDTAFDIANRYASEHLILQLDQAEQWVAQVQNAGSVFVGAWTPESLGDYCSGTNHVLPTSGWARSHSGLSLIDFMKRITVQQATQAGLQQLGPVAEILAATEGLDAHRLAVSYRLDKVKP